GTTGTDGKLASLPTPTRDYYHFDGWFTALEGGERVTTDTVFSDNDTIYAHWTREKVTVTFHYNYVGANNDGVFKTETIDKGTAVAKPADGPTRDGYTFTYWYTEAECQSTFNFSNIVTTDKHLYAGWVLDDEPVPETYTVTFYYNYDNAPDEGVYTTQTVVENGTATKPADGPTRDGYTFTKWYKEAACQTEYVFSTAVTGDLKLYAGWEEKDVVTGISVSGPTKKDYIEGQAFNPAGLIVTAHWSVSGDKVLEASEYSYDTPDTGTTGTKTVTVTYVADPRFTAQFTITVVARSLTSLTFTGTLEHTSQYLGDTLNTDSLTFYAVYDNGDREDVTDDVTFSSATYLDASNKFIKTGTATITATYNTKTVTFDVTVVEHQVTALTFTGTLKKATYQKDETFSADGLSFKATLDGVTQIDVALSEITFSAPEKLVGGKLVAYGTIEITASYKGVAATDKITVQVNAPDTLTAGKWYFLGTFNDWGQNANTPQYVMTFATTGTGKQQIDTISITGVTFVVGEYKIAQYKSKNGTENIFENYKANNAVEVNPSSTLLTTSITDNDKNIKISKIDTSVANRTWNVTVTQYYDTDDKWVAVNIALNNIDWRDPTNGNHSDDAKKSTPKSGDIELRGNFNNNFNSSDMWSSRNTALVTKIGSTYYFQNVYLMAHDTFKVVKVGTDDTWYGLKKSTSVKFAKNATLALGSGDDGDNIYVGGITDGYYNIVIVDGTNPTIAVYEAKPVVVSLKANVTVKVGQKLTANDLTVTWGGTATTSFTLQDVSVAVQGRNTLKVICNGAIVEFVYNALGEYTVTYHANTTYTVSGMPSNTTALENSKLTEPTQPTLKGFRFDGWYTSDSLTTAWNFTDETVTGNVNLYAKWTAIEYEVVYVVEDGGTHSNVTTYTASNGVFGTRQLTDASKDYYTFVGWYTAAQNGEKVTVLSYDLLPDNSAQAKITLHAVFTPYVYTVEYKFSNAGEYTAKLADGTAATATFTYDGAAVNVPGADKVIIKEAGFKFVRWYLSGDADRTDVTVIDNAFVTGKSFNNNVITLYALIESRTEYTVTIHYNDGDNTTKDEKVYEGDMFAVPADPASRAGYTFDGWFTDDEYSDQYTTARQITGNLTLYAKWTAIEYTVTYSVGTGMAPTDPANPTKFTMDDGVEARTLLDAVAPNGWHFVGWYAGEDGDKVEVLSADLFSGSVTEITLVAKYERNKYTVTFRWNYESAPDDGVFKSVEVEYETALNLTLAEYKPTRVDYTFVEWQYNGNAWDGKVTGNLDVYALWEENLDTGYYFLRGDEEVSEDTFVYDGYTGHTGEVKDVTLAVGTKLRLVHYTKSTGRAEVINFSYIVNPAGAVTFTNDGKNTFTVTANKYAESTYTVQFYGNELTFVCDGYYCYRNMEGEAITPDPTEVEAVENTAYIIGNFTNGKRIAAWSSDVTDFVKKVVVNGITEIYFMNVYLEEGDAFDVYYNGMSEKGHTVLATGRYNISVRPNGNGGFGYEVNPYAALNVSLNTEKPIYVGHEVKPENLNVTYGGDALTTGYTIVADIAVSGENANTVTVIHMGTVMTIEYTATENVVTAISIESQPDTLNYFVGDDLKLGGLIVKLTYSDGSTKTVKGTDADMSDYITVSGGTSVGNESNPLAKQTATVTVTAINTAEGNVVSTVFTIGVYNKVTSIVIVKKPEKLEYVSTENVDKYGMIVEARFNNSELSMEIDYAANPTSGAYYTMDPKNGTQIGDINQINIIYVRNMGDTGLEAQSFTVPLDVTVNLAGAINTIEIITKPTKVDYTIGETADLSGLKIDVSYHGNGVPNSEVEYSEKTASHFSVVYQKGGERFQSGETYFTIYYRSVEVGTVTLNSLSSIHIKFDENILYDTLNEVTIPGEEDISVYGKEITIKGATRDNYEFGGWFEDTACTTQWGEIKDGSTVGKVTKSMTLYAKWIPQADGGDNVQVTYHSLTPGGEATVKFYAFGSSMLEGLTALENPDAAGYTFGGWYFDAQFGKPFAAATYEVWKEHTVLYAKWTADDYTVEYILPEGIDDANNVTEYKASAGTVKLNAPNGKLEGKKFNGWYTAAENGVEITELNPEILSLYAVEGKLTLYAVFDDIYFNIEFAVWHDQNKIESTTQHVKYGEKLTEPELNTERTGYRFLGWFVAKEGGKQWNFKEDVVTEQFDLITKYVKVHTVTFDYNDGTGKKETKTVDDGTAVPEPEAPTRSGYGFGGWYADGGEQPWNFDTKVTDDMTLTAKWVAEVSVTFYLYYEDGVRGEQVGKVTGITPGNSVGESMPEQPSRPGYKFVKWVYNGEEFTAETEVTADIEVYAEWIKLVTVTFMSAKTGGSQVGDVITVEEGKTLAEINKTLPAAPNNEGYRFL
ncbi:MAG: InlB B-repeat-containing protein, partial [Clostridiales bacterium]|nr:InlB B-repeat-containing protein [Clostridiales bacterium]